jgi:tetratricopeptide (TPR) repeat protein
MSIGSLASLRHLTVARALALSCVLPALAAAQPSAATTVADSAFQRSDWATAAREYERVVARDSSSGYAWLRLGASRHSLGDHAAAVRALERAARRGFQPINVQFRLARAYARLGDRERALAHLDSAARRGLPPQQLQTERDLDAVRGDARFAATLALAEATRYPCRSMPEAKQFDFWIGEWEVTPWALSSPQPGQQMGVNVIQPILEHCVLLENWRAANGGEGKSFNYFDTNLRRWRQVWMSDGGGALDYSGEYRDGAMRFLGWNRDARGNRVEQRLTFFNIARDTVRQLFEASSDSGKTWTSTFDGRYVRKGSGKMR